MVDIWDFGTVENHRIFLRYSLVYFPSFLYFVFFMSLYINR